MKLIAVSNWQKPFVDRHNATDDFLREGPGQLQILNALPGKRSEAQKEKIWSDIVFVAMAYHRQPKHVRQSFIVPDESYLEDCIERVKRYLGRARQELVRVESRASEQLQWLRLTSPAFEQPTIFDVGTRRIENLIELATEYRKATKASRAHKGTGSPVPKECIYELERVFKDATGKKPGSGEGPFAKFLHVFWEQMGRNRSLGAVVKDIKAARLAAKAYV